MSDLHIDLETVRNAAAACDTAAGSVPTALPVDASGCGSSAVTSAVDDFNLWAKVTYLMIAGRLRGQADDAYGAATAWEQAEAEIAANAGGQP